MAVAGVSGNTADLKVHLAAELDNRTLEELLVICEVKPATMEDIKSSNHPQLAFLQYVEKATTDTYEFICTLESCFSKVHRPRLEEMVKNFKTSNLTSEYFPDDNSLSNVSDEDEADEYFSCDESQGHRSDNGKDEFYEDEAKQFDELKEKIGLKDWTEHGVITLSNFHQLNASDCNPMSTINASNLITTFFSRLKSSDPRSVTIFKKMTQTQELRGTSTEEASLTNCPTAEESTVTSWLNALNSAKTNITSEHSEIHISCRDSVCAILHSCDWFLRQHILSKMSACQLAVPVLLPKISEPGIEFLLWELQQVTKTWVNDTGTIETPVARYPFPVVAAATLGNISISKSQILNTILGQVQENNSHSFFISSNEDRSPAVLSRGTLEAVWLVPNNKTLQNDFRLTRPTCFLNLRGPIQTGNMKKQEQFILNFANCVIIFTDKRNANEYASKLNEYKTKNRVILVVTSDDPRSPKGKPSEVHREGLTMLLCAGCNILPIAEEISKSIEETVRDEKNSMTLSQDGRKICEQLKIENTILNKNCSEAKEIVKEILTSTEDPKQFKSRVFKLQPHWKKWTQFFKDRKYQESGSEYEIDKYFQQMITERKKQVQTPRVLEMKKFCEALQNTSIEKAQFLIHWIMIHSNEWVLNTHKPLLETLLSTTEEKIRYETMSQLAEHSFGVELFFREIGQMYECSQDFLDRSMEIANDNDLNDLICKVVELFYQGIPLEIFDGDVCNVPLKWIQKVLEELKRRIGDVRILTISVLGMQSSGKSTLLNNLFGVNFRVASGRCTRGISVQLLEIEEGFKNILKCDLVMLIDTQGLGSPEKAKPDGPLLDNELATFSICLSDLTLINIRGEYIGKELSNILQIAAHAFIRMDSIKLKPSCIIIQQAVSDPKAYEKNYSNEQIIFRELDDAVVAAAKYEKKSGHYKCFTDIFEVTRGKVYDYNIHYIPCLSQGAMEPPSSDYSEKIIKLKSEILQFSRDKRYNQRLSDFSSRIKDLWKAVIQEDFVFSFRNSTEAIQYEELSQAYTQWILNVRSFIMDWELQEEQNIKNSTADEVQGKYTIIINRLRDVMTKKKDEVLEKLTSTLQILAIVLRKTSNKVLKEAWKDIPMIQNIK